MPLAIDSIGHSVQSGAKVFIKQHLKFSLLFTFSLVFIISLLAFISPFHSHFLSLKLLLGSVFSGFFGALMMRLSVFSVPKLARGIFEGRLDGFRAGILRGLIHLLLMTSLGLGSLALVGLISRLTGHHNPTQSVALFAGFAFGAAIQTLWVRLSGGFFKTASDIGSDWTSKAEFDLPEDDLRNPAMIADQIGDHVCNTLGFSINWFEKLLYTLIGLATFTSLIFPIQSTGYISSDLISLSWIIILGVISVVLSIGIGLLAFDTQAISKWVIQVIILHCLILLAFLVFGTSYLALPLRLSIGTGALLNSLSMGLLFSIFRLRGRLLNYLVLLRFEGAIVHILGHLAAGFMSLFVVGFPLVLSCVFAYLLGQGSVLSGILCLGYLGLGFSASSLIVVCFCTAGPIWDNICALSQLTQQPKKVVDKTHYLDGTGKIFMGMGKIINLYSSFLGIFIFSISYLFHLHSWIREVPALSHLNPSKSGSLFDFEIMCHHFFLILQHPKGILGLLVGTVTPFVFSGIFIFCLLHILRLVQTEIRYQFSTIAGIATGDTLPDYGSVVMLSLKTSQKWTILPISLSLIIPIFLSIVLGIQGAVGYVLGLTCCGFILSVAFILIGTLLNCSKKRVQSSDHDTQSADFMSLVIGDALGDVLKDCLGPSLGILIRMITAIAAMVGGVTLLVEFVK